MILVRLKRKKKTNLRFRQKYRVHLMPMTVKTITRKKHSSQLIKIKSCDIMANDTILHKIPTNT